MKAKIIAAACITLAALGSARGDESAFRARKGSKAPSAQAAPAAEPAAATEPYLARKGDTLWDVAEHFWENPRSWPELWALNPHFHNPHRIEPGDPIFFSRGPRGQEVHLPLEAVVPAAANETSASVATQVGTNAAEIERPSVVPIRIARVQAGHFISSHRFSRLGTVANRYILKTIYTVGDDLELALSREARVKPGDLLTFFDDSLAVTHPVNKTPQGYLVIVLAHARVLNVSGGVATCRIIESYDGVTDGMGATSYRRPITQVAPRATKVGVEGVVLAGMPSQSVLALEDVVFLDRGSLHGIETGAVLEVPIPEQQIYLGGILDLLRPVARILVISAQDKTATGVIVASRAGVVPGFRFVATAVSP